MLFGARDRHPVDARNVGERGLTITITGSAEVAPGEPRMVGDIDGDGLGDAALTAGVGGQAYVVFGRPRGESVRIDIRRPAPAGVMEIRGLSGNGDQYGDVEPAGDIDGDGYDDALVPGPARRRLAWVLRGGPRVALVRVRQPSARVIPLEGTRGWQNIAVGIGNHGGERNDDLAVTTEEPGRPVKMGVWFAFGRTGTRGYRFAVRRRSRAVRTIGRSAGYYVPVCGASRLGRCPADLDSAAAAFTLAGAVPVGDVNRDGFDDVLIKGLNARRRPVTRISFGHRASSSPGRSRTVPVEPFWFSLGDVDGDKIPDVLGTRRRERGVAIVHLSRSGRVAAKTRIVGRKQLYDFMPIGDPDGDGLADLLIPDWRGAVIVYGAANHRSVDVRRRSDRVVPIKGLG